MLLFSRLFLIITILELRVIILTVVVIIAILVHLMRVDICFIITTTPSDFRQLNVVCFISYLPSRYFLVSIIRFSVV